MSSRPRTSSTPWLAAAMKAVSSEYSTRPSPFTSAAPASAERTWWLKTPAGWRSTRGSPAALEVDSTTPTWGKRSSSREARSCVTASVCAGPTGSAPRELTKKYESHASTIRWMKLAGLGVSTCV